MRVSVSVNPVLDRLSVQIIVPVIRESAAIAPTNQTIQGNGLAKGICWYAERKLTDGNGLQLVEILCVGDDERANSATDAGHYRVIVIVRMGGNRALVNVTYGLGRRKTCR